MKSLLLLLVVLLALTLTRCGKVQDAAAPASGTFGNVYSVTLKTACIECHVPGGATHGSTLDFTTQQTAYTTLTTNSVTATD